MFRDGDLEADAPHEDPKRRLVRRAHVACAAAYGSAAIACFAASASGDMRLPMTVSYLRPPPEGVAGATSAVAGASSVGSIPVSAALGAILATACIAASLAATRWRSEVWEQVLLGISGPRHAERALVTSMVAALAAAVSGASDVYLFVATFSLVAASHVLLLACDFLNEGWASERGEPSLYLFYCSLLPAAVASAVPLGFIGGAVNNGVDVPGFVHAASAVGVLYSMVAPGLVYLRYRSRRDEASFARWEAAQAIADLFGRCAFSAIVVGGGLSIA